MRQLKSILSCLTLLALLGCGGGSADRGGNSDLLPDGAIPAPGSLDERRVSLLLEATPIQGDEWSLMLSAEDASDLYQLAGSVLFDPAMYELTSVEAGGGLGGPEDAYFVNSTPDEGKLDFAYTSRWFGRTNSGDLNLLRLRVRALGNFSLGDFSLPLEPEVLRLRDSAKRDLEPSLRRAGS